MTGRRHVDASQPNQDNYAIENFDDSAICIVSDVAGSRLYSEIGSRLVVDLALAYLKNQVGIGFNFANKTQLLTMSRELISRMKCAAKSKATEKELDFKEYAATFHAVVVAKNSLAYIHLGDGALVFINDNGEYQLANIPIKGEYINQTVFFTSDGAEQAVETFFLPYVPEFFSLATDGIENISLIYKDWSVHAPIFDYLRGFFNHECPKEVLQKFLCREEIEARSDDDKTVIIARNLHKCDESYEGVYEH